MLKASTGKEKGCYSVTDCHLGAQQKATRTSIDKLVYVFSCYP